MRRNMLFKKIVLLELCFFSSLGYFCLPIFADTVVLKTGQTVEGKIIENTVGFVKIDFEGVELTYFQDEIASVNQSQTNNAAAEGLNSLYEGFKSNKKAVENKKSSVGSVQPGEPTVSREVQNIVKVNERSFPQTEQVINSSTMLQTTLSQLPKEYQEMIKSKLQNAQGSSNAGQSLSTTGADLSGLPSEYQNIIKSSLEKIQVNQQETENFFKDLEKQ